MADWDFQRKAGRDRHCRAADALQEQANDSKQANEPMEA
jgi:hypothetical protein